MSIEILDFAEPFFTVTYVSREDVYTVAEPSILVNIADQPIRIQNQKLSQFESVVVTNTNVCGVERAVVVERFSSYRDEDALFEDVKRTWPLAYDIRKEERLKGVSHYLSPKISLGNINLSMYHSGSVPLLCRTSQGSCPLRGRAAERSTYADRRVRENAAVPGKGYRYTLP